MKSYDVTIKGMDPGLLMHRFSPNAEAEVSRSNATKKVSKKIGTPQEEAEETAYRLDDGELYQPAEHIYQALRKASTEFQIKGRGKKTYKDAVTGNVIVEPECIPHGTKEFRIDARPVRVQRARVMRHRAWLPKWSLSFAIHVLHDEELPEETVNSILHRAGEIVGIGDYRPRFGRFMVTHFAAAKAKKAG